VSFSRFELIVIALAVMAMGFSSMGCSRKPSRTYERRGVSLWQVGARNARRLPEDKAQPGDWAIFSSAIGLVVAGVREGSRTFQPPGSLAQVAVANEFGKELRELRPLLKIRGKEGELRTIRIEPVWRNGRPAIQVVSEVAGQPLEVKTDIALEPEASRAVITSTVTNRGKARMSGLQLGDSVLWPGDATFAPTLGYVNEPAHAKVSWIARRGRTLSCALAFPHGEAEVDFNFSSEGPFDQIATSASFALDAKKSKSYQRFFIALRGGLSRAAEAAWRSTGYSVVRINGSVKPVPTWASIEAREAGQGPLMAVSASADGSFQMALPEGNYEVSARTPGGVDTASIDVSSKAYQTTLELFSAEPGKLLYRVRDDEGHPSPARLIVLGSWPTKNPVFGPEAAGGAANMIYTRNGIGEVELAKGHYRVVITRGIEYELARSEFQVEENQGAVVRAVVKKKVSMKGWRAADLHLHAAPSYDSEVSIEDRVVSLIAEGIRLGVATDHNTVTDYAKTITRLGVSDLLTAAPGVEVTTERPNWGHFNVWPLEAGRAPPPSAGIDPRKLFAEIRNENPSALIQVNHPWMKELQIGYFDIAEFDAATGKWSREGFSLDFDAIEVINGFELNNRGRIEHNLENWFKILNLERRYPATAGSDSHRLRHIVGYPRTYLRIPEDTAPTSLMSEAAAAVRAGRSQVTTGPLIELKVSGGEPGDLVRAVDATVDIEVSVFAASWVGVDSLEVVSNGQTVMMNAVSSPREKAQRAHLYFRLPVTRDCWFVAVARGSDKLDEVLPYIGATPIAFTNPVYVDADGDGWFGAPPTGTEGRHDAAPAAEAAPEVGRTPGRK
jgi:hypothetical protein